MITLKANQKTLYNDDKDFFEYIEDQNYFKDYKIQKWECNIEKGHGRSEKREYYLCSNLSWLENKDQWFNLNAIGMVRCRRKTLSGESIDTRYFINSITDVQKIAKAL